MKKSMTIRELQSHISGREKGRGKNASFLKLMEEVGELAEVIRRNHRLKTNQSIKGTVEEELYDVLRSVVALANAYDIDLEKCRKLKERYQDRRWK
ncbi:MazG nucleotide pyrophosphohydrolase domain-containing protein [Alteribacter lacisalsi]|nr:MazG nucleotide pyrophosphohydrolase domain-containing protein [Alteribacter lacisalsi]